MTRIFFKTFLVCISFLFVQPLYSQGCSDAGFCTISSFKPNSTDSVASIFNQVKAGVFFGNADNSIAVFGNYLEYNRVINDKLAIEVKLTTIAQTGNDISVFGVSDVFVNGAYEVKKNFKVILGAKIPLSLANNTKEGLPLPMDYQASLGTVDLILGTGYKFKKWQFIAAIQQPLTQNENAFFSNTYPIDSELRSFQSTNAFKRSGDVLLRVSYALPITDKLIGTLSMLPIYHLANDKYTDELNVEREIIGSEGLTLNSNFYLDYKFNDKNIVQFNLGFPLIVRDSRPDGLTRSSIATLEYKIRF